MGMLPALPNQKPASSVSTVIQPAKPMTWGCQYLRRGNFSSVFTDYPGRDIRLSPYQTLGTGLRLAMLIASILGATLSTSTGSTGEVVSIAVSDAGFEGLPLAGDYALIANQSNWAWSDGNIYIVRKAWVGLSGGGGTQALLLEPYAVGGNHQYIQQTLTNSLQVGRYTLVAAVGHAKDQLNLSQDTAAVMRLLSYNASTGSYHELASTTIPADSLARISGTMTDCFLTLDVPAGYVHLGEQLVVSLGATGSVLWQNLCYDNVRLNYVSGQQATYDGYADWAARNVGGQALDLDFDNDGVANGIEYFLTKSGPSTSINSLPVPSITWLRDPSAAAAFNVQASDDLSTWKNILPDDPRLDVNANSVTYLLAPPDNRRKQFVRLKVSP
jgi:hypothetical protein